MSNQKNEIIKYLKSQISFWDVITSKEILVGTLLLLLPPVAIGMLAGVLLTMTTSSENLLLCVVPVGTVGILNIFWVEFKRQKTIQSVQEKAEKNGGE